MGNASGDGRGNVRIGRREKNDDTKKVDEKSMDGKRTRGMILGNV